MAQETYKGSCLCGGVRYELTGEPGNFFHCHCSRCRKASGTGHASNLFVATDAIHWSGDESLRSAYKVPDARFFTTGFCTNCGSKIPRYIERANLAIIPLGSLDHDIDARPTARIFWNSRMSWSCDGDAEVQRYPEAPPM